MDEKTLRAIYGPMTDHDINVAQIVRLENLNTKLDTFIADKKELCVKHEKRMDCMEDNANKMDRRVGVVETYFKVLVGASVLFIGVFGVYLIKVLL